MLYFANAFSLQMVEPPTSFEQVSVTPEAMKQLLETDPLVCKAIGHRETAAVLTGMLGVEIPYNRQNILLKPGDTLYVAQVVGGRLPEGSTTLPPGVKIEFRRVDVVAGRLKP